MHAAFLFSGNNAIDIQWNYVRCLIANEMHFICTRLSETAVSTATNENGLVHSHLLLILAAETERRIDGIYGIHSTENICIYIFLQAHYFYLSIYNFLFFLHIHTVALIRHSSITTR